MAASNPGMAKSLFVVLAALVPMLPAVAADQSAWGPTVDGLKMSIALTANPTDPDAELRITVKNASNEAILAQLGHILNQRIIVLSFRAFVTTLDGSERTVISGPAKIGGSFAISPLAVELIPNASYTVATPLVDWRDWNGPTDLKALLSKPSQVRVELDTTKTECPEGCLPGVVFSCWRGKLVSNVLQVRR
jgi:hypothetical protein